MSKKAARLISFIFHPIVFALLIPFLFVYEKTTDLAYGLKWMIFSLFFLFITLLIFYLLRPKEFFSDFDISIKEQRHLFYSTALLTAVLYFIAALLFKGILFPLSIVALGIILGLVVFDISNYYIKVSIHMAVSTAYTVTIAMLFGLVPFFIFIWILPLMAWARLTLHKHTSKELLAGMLLGEVVTIATFLIGRNIQ